jgi:hypothetical protein
VKNRGRESHRRRPRACLCSRNKSAASADRSIVRTSPVLVGPNMGSRPPLSTRDGSGPTRMTGPLGRRSSAPGPPGFSACKRVPPIVGRIWWLTMLPSALRVCRHGLPCRLQRTGAASRQQYRSVGEVEPRLNLALTCKALTERQPAACLRRGPVRSMRRGFIRGGPAVHGWPSTLPPATAHDRPPDRQRTVDLYRQRV